MDDSTFSTAESFLDVDFPRDHETDFFSVQHDVYSSHTSLGRTVSDDRSGNSSANIDDHATASRSNPPNINELFQNFTDELRSSVTDKDVLQKVLVAAQHFHREVCHNLSLTADTRQQPGEDSDRLSAHSADKLCAGKESMESCRITEKRSCISQKAASRFNQPKNNRVATLESEACALRKQLLEMARQCEEVQQLAMQYKQTIADMEKTACSSAQTTEEKQDETSKSDQGHDTTMNKASGHAGRLPELADDVDGIFSTPPAPESDGEINLVQVSVGERNSLPSAAAERTPIAITAPQHHVSKCSTVHPAAGLKSKLHDESQEGATNDDGEPKVLVPFAEDLELETLFTTIEVPDIFKENEKMQSAGTAITQTIHEQRRIHEQLRQTIGNVVAELKARPTNAHVDKLTEQLRLITDENKALKREINKLTAEYNAISVAHSYSNAELSRLRSRQDSTAKPHSTSRLGNVLGSIENMVGNRVRQSPSK